MRLQGNIDAAVNGGVAKYRSAFFSPEGGGGGAAAEAGAGAGAGQLVELLAGQLEEQAQLLGEVLQLHGQLAPEPLQVTLTLTCLLSSAISMLHRTSLIFIRNYFGYWIQKMRQWPMSICYFKLVGHSLVSENKFCLCTIEKTSWSQLSSSTGISIYLSITLHEQHSLSLSHLQPLHERLVSLYAEMRTWMVKSQLLGAR